MLHEAEIRLKQVSMPAYYENYQKTILKKVQSSLQIASQARKAGIDVADIVEPKIAYDLADRVAKMHDLDIADRLRLLLSQTTKEKAALKIAEEIAAGEYGTGDVQTRLDSAVRVSLAVVTEGVTVAPLQGISDVRLKRNADGSQYLSISFAGPIRSAGGTEAALTMLIADHARKVAGLAKYVANSFDDETARFVEELRIYEREVGSFQFKVLDEDVVKCISSLPVELDGVDTDPVEVVGHKGMKRISTDRVRGGALRVMNDGLIGRSRKLLKLVETLKLEGWDWLRDLKGAVQAASTDDDDAVHHRMSEVITGRPVLSMAKKLGGFRLRYGRCCNTGFATVGIHPAVPALLNYAIVAGTQFKMDTPGKASTLAFVDTIEPPLVRLKDGRVTKVPTVEAAEKIRPEVEKILYLGDILISYGDFLENNATLLPASYVEEIWCRQLRSILASSADIDNTLPRARLVHLCEHPLQPPSVKEAFEISLKLGMPLHPRYSFYWDAITVEELVYLKQRLGDMQTGLTAAADPKLKDILERLGVMHSIVDDNVVGAASGSAAVSTEASSESKGEKNDSDSGASVKTKTKIVIDDPDQQFSLARLLLPLPSSPVAIDAKDSIEFISKSSGIQVKPKFASSIAIRVGRPEKAAERKMKPPVHVLFPVGIKGGASRDILKACKQEPFYAEIANRFCDTCGVASIGTHCRRCGAYAPLRSLCIACRQQVDSDNRCPRCGREGKTFSPVMYPLKAELDAAQRRVGFAARDPFKGVRSLMSKDRASEPLEKGLLRQKYDLHAFKDGTIRFDATNEPLTHFKPSWIMTSVKKLRELGYTRDYLGNELESPDQLVELLLQDVVIPMDSASHLLRVAKFVDEELVKLYGLEPFYNATTIEDLIGHTMVGLAPHTSVGIVGRIIGFTNSQVCLASPIWHSAKRRDCDGDADSLMLLMDTFLNFSFDFLPDKIGGLMDAPLLVQPVVLPHEVQRQAHNVDVAPSYPLEFYEATWKQSKAGDISSANMIDIVKNRIGTDRQFFDYGFTHFTGILTTSVQHSAYSTLSKMEEKLKMQIDTARLIKAVDPDEVAAMVLTTHILPDIMGNMRSYSSQGFRCTSCGEKYRRMPLMGHCTKCGKDLIPTVTRGSVEKYLGIALNICGQFKVNDYLKSRVNSLAGELKLIFQETGQTGNGEGKEKGSKSKSKEQTSLMEFMG
jgi:DNA polymerase II large subunit